MGVHEAFTIRNFLSQVTGYPHDLPWPLPPYLLLYYLSGAISLLMNPEHVKPQTIRGAVITVSSSRTKDTDKSGRTIIHLLEQANIQISHYAIVPDTVPAIRNEAIKAAAVAECIILSGGTGLTHDDCTIEAITPLLDKKIDGFGELFRLLSYQDIGSSAMLSRALAGVLGGKAVFCIPGSTGAVELAATKLILPEITHILTHANK